MSHHPPDDPHPRVRQKRRQRPPAPSVSSQPPVSSSQGAHLVTWSGTLVFKETFFTQVSLYTHANCLSGVQTKCNVFQLCRQTGCVGLNDRAWASNVGLSKETLKVNFLTHVTSASYTHLPNLATW